jgi:hypothetical protein
MGHIRGEWNACETVNGWPVVLRVSSTRPTAGSDPDTTTFVGPLIAAKAALVLLQLLLAVARDVATVLWASV